MGGRAKAAQIYPDKLCRAILHGLKLQLVIDGVMRKSKDLMYLMMATDGEDEVHNVVEDELAIDQWDQYYDDVSGKWLNTELVESARREEMQVFAEHKVYSKVPIEECRRVTSKEPVGSKWIDINKGDSANPEYRSRLVAQEIKRDVRDDLFAATPPLEAKKALFSLAASSLAKGRSVNDRGVQKLLFVDVKRAYFYAQARRDVYVKLPPEDHEHGMCGKLNKAMYGTRDAASNWEHKYRAHLESVGFTCGKSTPCAFYHHQRKLRLVVHGDDYTFLGSDAQLQWAKKMMSDEYEIKVRGLLGPDKTDDKQIRILNRCLEWRPDGLAYEADPRHAEIVVKELGMMDSKAVVTPGIKVVINEDEDDPRLGPEASTKYKQLVARLNFLSQDRHDIAYATKELARGMANPTESDLERLKRMGRYLRGRMRYVIRYHFQKDTYAINSFSDSDWAGDLVTRKSTSGGCLMIGDHCIKAWSINQSVIALSSGEAEFYALTRASAMAMGLRSLLEDLGVTLKIRVLTDATTGKSIASRRGLGKVRHIATHELWVQEKVMRGEIELIKIKNIFNPADLFTKHLDKQTMDSCVIGMGHAYEDGRNAAAPSLNQMSDQLVVLKYKQEADTRVEDDSFVEPCNIAMMSAIIDNIVLGYEDGMNTEFKDVMHLLKDIGDTMSSMAASEEEIGSTMDTKRVAHPSSTDA